jgi:predicted acyltransferase
MLHQYLEIPILFWEATGYGETWVLPSNQKLWNWEMEWIMIIYWRGVNRQVLLGIYTGAESKGPPRVFCSFVT